MKRIERIPGGGFHIRFDPFNPFDSFYQNPFDAYSIKCKFELSFNYIKARKMFFTEELDDKPFRLFVHRVLYLLKNHRMLSPAEREIAFLIEEHPEVGISISGAADVNRHYGPDEYNPFLYLSALCQVHKQMTNDRPRGILKIIRNAFDEHLNEPEIRGRLAIAYLDLYLQEKTGQKEFTAELYLKSISQILTNPLYFDSFEADNYQEEPYEEMNEYYLMNSLMDRAIDAYSHQIHEDESRKSLNINTRLETALAKLPGEWVDAMALYWKRPAFRLKKERAADLGNWLLSDHVVDELKKQLDQDEKAVIKIISEHDGYIQYGTISKKFGDEKKDDFWWKTNPPKSVIGRLRLKGLIYVGRTPMNTRNYKIILIPKDLRPVLQQII